MRSSEPAAAVRLALAALVAALLNLAACTGAPPAADQPARPDQTAASASVPCEPAPSTLAPDPKVLTELRTATEKSPLFLAAGARGPAMACAITGQGSAWTLAYRFKDGATFIATVDSQIEYSNQQATFTTPPEQPMTILQRAEREAFGSDGCGIDWNKSTSETSADGLTISAIFRGPVCSCQARVTRAADGRVIGLLLRSSC